MNADPAAQLRLLDLQATDSGLDRLEHRERTLPELAEIATLTERLAGLESERVRVATEDSDLARAQAKVEADVDLVRTRMQRDQQRLDAGSVGSPRELENLQSEIQSLQRRQADLEDDVLVLMERREGLQSRLDELAAEAGRDRADLAAAQSRRDAALAELADERRVLHHRRAALAGELPADLLALYEKVRAAAAAAGVGAAALLRGRCEGCHLQLNTVELNAIRQAPPDEVLRCEECRRILVRTAESGL